MSRVVNVTTASTVKPRKVAWLWRDRIPLGKITILAGAAGQGKSQLTCLVAALTSMGSAPGDLIHKAHDVLIVSAEDDPEDTIVPRLIAADAELTRCHFLDMRESIDGVAYQSTVALPGDVSQVHAAAKRYDVKLVVLDPVSGLLDDDHSAISGQQVRRALGPVKELAQDVGCAVVCVMHPNKAAGTNALARIADSGAFTQLARSVMLMGPDPSDPEGERGSRKVLALPKSNLASKGDHSLSLEIQSHTLHIEDGEIETSRLTVLGASEVTAADILQAADDDKSALGEARAFLRTELADGPRLAKEVKAAADGADIAAATLRRAREIECVAEKERGEHGPWRWRLKTTKPDVPAHDEHLEHLPAPIVQGVQDEQGAGGPRRDQLTPPEATFVARLEAAFPDAEWESAA